MRVPDDGGLLPPEALLARLRSEGDLRGRGPGPDVEEARRQRARFDVLLEAFRLDGATVLEVGCGDGAFASHLEHRGVRAVYTGLDISPDAVRLCRERHPEARFVSGYFLQHEPDWPYDYVVVLGLDASRVEGLDEAVERIARHAFALCSRAAWLSFTLRPGQSPEALLRMGRSIAPHARIWGGPVPTEAALSMSRRNLGPAP